MEAGPPPPTSSSSSSTVLPPPTSAATSTRSATGSTSGSGSGSLDFSKVKLKTVEKKTEPSAVVTLLCSGSEDYDRLMKETYFEQYWDSIKKFSFPSELVHLPPAAAQAIIDEHKKKKDSDWTQGENKDILLCLANKIDEVAKKNDWAGLFVRLSSRSPKDAAMSQPNFGSIVKEQLGKIKDEEIDNPTSHFNRNLHAIYRSITLALEVTTGKEGINLLIKSDRIQEDLQKVVAENDQNFNIVVREFSTFDMELEIRGFVYKKQLTGLTQYCPDIMFPNMLKCKDEIVQVIQQFVDKEIKALPIENLVLDFALKYPTKDSTWKVYVVELNPLAEFAGSGMFAWEKDRDVLLGKKPFEFRTVTSLPNPESAFIQSDHKPFLLTEQDK